MRLHHGDRVLRRGGVILAANHVGVSDGPMLAIFSPRPAHALTKVEMFKGVMGWFLMRCGQIPVDRYSSDPAAVKISLRALREGQVVAIFPEGARGDGELDLFHRGAGYLALVTGAPIVPVSIFGSREPGGHSSSVPAKGAVIDLVYGRPFTVDAEPWPRTRARVAEVSRDLRERMLEDLADAKTLLGRDLPGPLPAGEHEPDPGGGVTEKSK